MFVGPDVSLTGLVAQRAREAARFDFMPGVLPAGATLTRASVGTCFASNGLLTTFAANGARFDHDPETLGLRGLLIEPTATNLIFPAIDFTTVWFTEHGATLTANQIIAPDGSMTAGALFLPSTTAAGTFRTLARFSPGISGQRTVSVWLKGAVGGERVQLLNTPEGTTYLRTDPDPLVLSNSWQRFALSGTQNDPNTYVILGVDNRSGLLSTADQTIHVWGAQAELAASASSFIATTGAAVTRAADALVLDWASKGLADGSHVLRFGFDDGSSQDVMTTVTGGTATVPTALNRAWIRSVERV